MIAIGIMYFKKPKIQTMIAAMMIYETSFPPPKRVAPAASLIPLSNAFCDLISLSVILNLCPRLIFIILCINKYIYVILHQK